MSAEPLYGGETRKAIENFPISGEPVPVAVIHWLGRIKGAAAVVNYSEPVWPEQVLAVTDGAGPRTVFDGVGGEIAKAAFAITAQGGRFSAHGAPSGGFAHIDAKEAERRDITVRGIEHVQFTRAEAKALTERAMSKAVAKQIRPVIGQTFPLERAADAHRLIEARDVIGKTLLVI